jgi:hypothetical protein
MTKLDLKKGDLKDLYAPPADEVVRVDVPPLQYVMLDGEGYPGDSALWEPAMSAVYGISYKIKFASKALGTDYVVMPLEGLWWTDDMHAFSMDAKHLWKWTVMILQPDHVTADLFAQAREDARRSKSASPLLDQVRFETLHEGACAQIMHLGPFAEEGPTIARLHQWIADQGYTHHGAGRHHEIYLSDMTRTAPARLRTVIRQPMLPAHEAGEAAG